MHFDCFLKRFCWLGTFTTQTFSLVKFTSCSILCAINNNVEKIGEVRKKNWIQICVGFFVCGVCFMWCSLFCHPGITPLVTLFLNVPKINILIDGFIMYNLHYLSFCVYVNFVGMLTYEYTLKSLKDPKNNLIMILFKSEKFVSDNGKK